MISRAKLVGLFLGPLTLLSGTGCIIIGGFGSHGCYDSPRVWVETTEEFPIETVGLTELQVRTHNGAITYRGQPAADATGVVLVTKKAGGVSQADAEEAMEAIQVYSESEANGVHRLGWKWSPLRRKGWSATVSFDIQAPGGIRFDAESHNGWMEVTGVTADVRLVTHNGRIKVDSSGGKLRAETHNGRIEATYEGENVTVLTRNGRILADLRRCGALAGSVTTHNGGIDLVLGESVSAELACETHNGSITADVPIQTKVIKRGSFRGVIGEGGGKLRVKTHNGSIRIKHAAG